MAQAGEAATASVESVSFGFLTDKEVRKNSFVKIINPILLDQLDRPAPGGLYDPAMGPIEERDSCRQCGLKGFKCTGHCGHVELVAPLYNPLMFRMLYNLLQKTCFHCHEFRDERRQVRKYTSKLALILKGDIVGAKSLDFSSESSPSEDNNTTHERCPSSNSEVDDHIIKDSEQHSWTSLQYKEAMSVLSEFVKNKAKQCSKCKFKNPTITCPTFGWMHANLSKSSGRANAIVDYNLEGLTTKEVEERKNVVDSDEMESSGVDDGGTLESNPESYKPMSFTGPLLPSEVKDKIKRLWDNETQLCSLICDIQGKRLCMSEKNMDYSMFFIEALLVPPIKFRAPSKGGDSVTAHAQTVLLSKVLQSNISLGNALVKKADHSKIVPRWMELQQSVNFLFGNKKTMGQGENAITGICQLLEKKEGIFRQKMMGKRVNYACRSVISPDPYLAVNEIGIPPYFALRLTYPERVTPWNVDKLRNCIINGPLIHPGATNYMDKLKSQKLPENNRKTCISISRKLPSSIGCVSQLGNTVGQVHEGKIVYRHIQDGDIVLVNRQPTLHKPSIMAHVVRVLKGEKTLRMHYANCSTYNADFDGDELNVHFPQDEISRAEAYNIVNANNQYIIPTSGDTRRGLIQDHIVSAVLLTKKDTFLTKDEYNHLFYSSGIFATARGSFTGKPGKKVSMVNIEDEIEPILPTILKPEPLWSGKQIITSLLHHITRTKALPPLTVEKRATIPSKYFGGRDEGYLLIRKNEFVDGVVDKAQFGKYGLVHTVQEFYGSDTAGILLSGLSRLFTVFLQMHGFTCGVDDLLLERSVDMERIKLLGDAKNIGQAVYFDFANEADETENKDGGKIDKDVRNELGDFKDKHIDPVKLQMDVERAVRVNGESAISVLDTMMASAINELTSKVNNNVISLPKGLQKPFPDNCFILMTISGAKGGQVNFSQISSLLGQQSLEGKRVPLMISGKTLPCFPPWEPAPRAGGFISDCFLSGLRPQEYYFHCMAGREGLVDTAVKTSRSGYLQRCLVKNLECLKVGYDHTVRDADGSIVQFCYGEDGVDVHKTSFLSEFDKLASNQRVLVEKHANQYQDAKSVNSDSFIRDLPEALEERAQRFISELSKKQRATFNLKRRKDFMNLVKLKYQSSLAQPGEPVGVIAAQSVGEPSTQMTLNTFHHAGQKESNVTLGIPRLQEILMRASENMQTPVMQCPLKEGKTKEDAQRLAEKLRKVTVADIIERIEVGVVPFSVENHKVSTIYKLKMKLFKPELYPPSSNITLEDCHDTLKVFFVEELEKAIQNHLTMLSKISGIKNIVERTENITVEETDEADPHRKQKKAELENDDDNENDDDSGDETEEQDADSRKRRRQATDEIDYEDSMENENTVSENKDIEEDALTEIESDVDVVGVEVDSKGDDNKILVNTEDEFTTGSISKSKKRDKELKAESRKEGARARRVKETDRTIFVEAKGLDFEVHLRFTDDPHVLLSQIAHKAAKNIYIKSSGNIDECSVVAVKESIVESGYLVEKEHQGLHTAGVNFGAFWDMQDDLDVRKITSNDIHAILNTYGIEAARATLIKEVKAVFQTHGASVDVRHLSLIADFMTHSGQYRPMSRHGMAASTSPLSKMSFETASTFIVEAAYHGLVDDLESPSARICLGLPVKMGTGSFDLMQKIQF